MARLYLGNGIDSLVQRLFHSWRHSVAGCEFSHSRRERGER
jgi:hypothetical protein